MFTNEEKAACARRELAQRKHVYTRLVENGRMTQVAADKQIALMEEIAKDYEALAEKERLL